MWVIEEKLTMVDEDDVGRTFKPCNDPLTPSLKNSQPNFFPWRPKQFSRLLEESLIWVKIEAGRRLKLSKDPP